MVAASLVLAKVAGDVWWCLMKTHYQPWAGVGVTACGLSSGHTMTTDESRVDCLQCRRSHRYRDAVNDDPPPMPSRRAKVATRVRQALEAGPSTVADIASAVSVTGRRVRQVLVESGAERHRHWCDRRVVVWTMPQGGWRE